MAMNKSAAGESDASKFYMPGMSRQSTAPGRIERFLSAHLPEFDEAVELSAEIPDYGFYLPGVTISDHDDE